jgi:hypothetical protein
VELRTRFSAGGIAERDERLDALVLGAVALVALPEDATVGRAGGWFGCRHANGDCQGNDGDARKGE